jgi:hypothetical protein
MVTGLDDVDRWDRKVIVVAIGSLLMLIGVTAAIAGPVEMYCFSLFSQGGRFHYEGFGFGSLMFGNIASQIIGYYLIAMVFIPLGYGHLRRRRWARPLALALLWFWTILGIPISLAFLFALLSAKPLSSVLALAVVIAVVVAYPAIPSVLIRFYRREDVRTTFEEGDSESCWIEGLPVPILVLGLLFAFYVVVLHILILFNGIFPLFGIWMTELPGIALIDIASLSLVVLIWGVLARRRWAWWGSLLYFALITVSWVLTLATSTWSDILRSVDFPPFEMEMLEGLPLQGFHLAILVGVPLLLTIGAILRAKGCFDTRRRGQSGPPSAGKEVQQAALARGPDFLL